MRPAPPKRLQHSRFPPRIYVSQGGDPARPMPRRNQCREESVAGIALGRLHDESPVDLDLAERHPIERPELGIPRAEVVQGQAYPHHAQPRHRFHRLHGLAEDFCLGQFDDEPVRGNPMLRQRRRESLENGRLLQRPCVDIHGDGKLHALLLPGSRLGDTTLDDEVAQPAHLVELDEPPPMKARGGKSPKRSCRQRRSASTDVTFPVFRLTFG